MATKITRTGTTPTNTNKYTWSAWIKRGSLGVGESILYNYYDGNNRGYIAFDASDKLFFYDKYGSEQNNCYSTRLLRDTFGWYHLHIKTDSTLGSDRFVVHINGVRETITGTTIDQNDTLGFKVATGSGQHSIGTNADSTANPFTGIISHVHYVDGLAIAHTEFGETDATTGEWKIITSPTVSEYGANGYFILKDGNSLTDQSGKGNNFALAAGTLTNTEDCPSNVFCTIDPKRTFGGNLTYSNSNLTGTAGGGWHLGACSLGANKGKYYWEHKITTLGTGGGYHKIGITSDQVGNDSAASHGAATELDGGYVFYCQNGSLEARTDQAVISGWDTSSTGITFALNDVMCIAVDMDNKFMYFRKNGDAWAKSGDPTSGATGTGGVNISSDFPSTNLKYMLPTLSIYSNGIGSLNFGNGYFGTTAVASAGTNASGNGVFEFDVPTGYTALSTKGLNN